jgi:hypothetical protein
MLLCPPFVSMLFCGSTITEFERVLDRVVVGDCDALSSVQPSSALSSSSPTSKWTVGCASGEGSLTLAECAGGFLASLFAVLRTFLDDDWRARWPLEWFLRMPVVPCCWCAPLTMAPDEAWRLKLGRGLLGADVEPEWLRWWCRAAPAPSPP